MNDSQYPMISTSLEDTLDRLVGQALDELVALSMEMDTHRYMYNTHEHRGLLNSQGMKSHPNHQMEPVRSYIYRTSERFLCFGGISVLGCSPMTLHPRTHLRRDSHQESSFSTLDTL